MRDGDTNDTCDATHNNILFDMHNETWWVCRSHARPVAMNIRVVNTIPYIPYIPNASSMVIVNKCGTTHACYGNAGSK